MVKKATVTKLRFAEEPAEKLLKLDLGTGKGQKCPDGYVGVDMHKHDGVKVVTDLRKRWPWPANSVDAVHCDYVLQYFTAEERVHFMNELYRVMKVDAEAHLVTPHWCSGRAYMDNRAVWPPISEAWFHILNKAVRDMQNYVDDSGFTCDFDVATMGYGMHPTILVRAKEFQETALQYYKEAAQDLHVNLVKKAKTN